ncbi:MAG: hypothetical protein IJX38_05725 [Clostridia bacterium]|nr:hypothetical protein [Clostridia bacterium]
MKRIVYLATVLMIVLSPFCLLVSCSSEITPEQLTSQICSAYGIEGAAYSSRAAEGEEGYISERLESVLFDSPIPPSVHYSLVLHSKLDSLYEVGVFSCPGGEDRLYVRELSEKRLELLEATASVGEGVALVRGELVIYVYMPDASGALDLIDRILG